MASNDDIMRALGRLEGKLELLQADFEDEKQRAHESRAVMHRRLDDQVLQISRLDTTVALAGHVDAQLHDKIDSIAEAVDPALIEWGRIKMLGYGVSGLIALAGVSVAGLVWWAGEAAVTAIRHWLRIT